MRSGDLSRRHFLEKIGFTGAAAIHGMGSKPAMRQSKPAAPANARTLLTGSDFSFLGYYDMQTLGTNSTYTQGFTSRYVRGDFRLLVYDLDQKVREVSLSGKNYGDLVNSPTNAWNLSTQQTISGQFVGLWWEESKSRLWTVSAYDYNGSYQQGQIQTRTLNDNGTTSNFRGPVGLSGIPAKRFYGGAQAVPSWFQTKYNVGQYVVGWGGYTSLMAQGGGCSLGPAMYAIPDPGGYGNNTEMPFKTVMDCAGGTTLHDWYGKSSPTSFDRGMRLTLPINYFDNGDPRQNPSTPPTNPPQPGAQWLSPAPDGRGRFVWGDSYYNTGCWIDGTDKHGFILIASLGYGKCWYGNSTLHYDGRAFELHVFDPVHFGESIAGMRTVWNVRPSSMTQLSLPGLGFACNGNGPTLNVGGATYDPLTRRLYLMAPGVNACYNRIYVYAVNA
jgi:hypothetical protein